MQKEELESWIPIMHETERRLVGEVIKGGFELVPEASTYGPGLRRLLSNLAGEISRQDVYIRRLEEAADASKRTIANLETRLAKLELDNAKRGQDGTK
jgi:hypothetical protein